MIQDRKRKIIFKISTIHLTHGNMGNLELMLIQSNFFLCA